MKITIKTKPGSKEQSIKIIKDMFGMEIYEIKIRSLPKEGEANKEVIELLAKHFKTPKSKIKIESGLTSRNKIISIKI